MLHVAVSDPSDVSPVDRVLSENPPARRSTLTVASRVLDTHIRYQELVPRAAAHDARPPEVQHKLSGRRSLAPRSCVGALRHGGVVLARVLGRVFPIEDDRPCPYGLCKTAGDGEGESAHGGTRGERRIAFAEFCKGD